MSFKSSSRTGNKKDYPSDTLDTKLRRDNFNRLKSIFEIRRPHKARNTTLRKSKSTSALSGSASQSSDDERETTKDVVFVRNSTSRCSIRNDNKYKKRSLKIDPKGHSLNKNSGNNTPEDNKTPLIAELETKLKKQKKDKKHDPFVTNFTFDKPFFQQCRELKEKLDQTNCNSTDNTPESENEVFSSSEDMHNERQYTKSTFKSHSPNTNYALENSSRKISKSSKEIISQQPSKDDHKRIKSFVEADCEGETEKYRKNLVSEMDREVAKMKLDGFIDEDENLNTENVEQDTNEEAEESVHQVNEENECSQLDTDERNYSNNKYKQLFEGIFSELDKKMQMIEYESQMTLQLNKTKKYDHEPQNHSNSDNEKLFVAQEESCLTAEEQFNEQGKKETSGEHESVYLVEEKPLIDESYEFHNIHSSDKELEEREKEEIHSVEQKILNKETDIPHTDDESANKLTHHKLHPNKLTQSVSFADEFCESLGDDLENGSYFVEAYNDEGRELVIVEISLERRTVNLNRPFPLKNIEKSIKDADMVFHEKDDKSLNLIEDATEFIHENAEVVSSEFSTGPDSNRSTVYSTTSRESDVFDDDDEGISMGNAELKTRTDDDGYNNVRRETFCDHKGIVRIERVGYPETVRNASLEDLQASVSRNNSFTQKGKLSYIIDEIKYTEKKYVADLNKVVKKYMPYIERHTPPNLLGRQYFMFGNIQTLCENQKKFLAALENCSEEAEDIIRTFIDFKDLFKLYPTYFKNKPKADVVIKEFNAVIKQAQDRFKERLDLSAYLLTPLQRLGKYKLFLENIEKQLQKLELPTENATAALEMIKKEMSKGNDFVAIESIQHSPILKSDYGSFKMREIFTIMKPRRFEAMVFLFENVVVFTTLGNQRNMEIYTYYDSIKMNDLRIATFEDATIHLTNFTKGKQLSRADRFTYVLEAKTEKLKDVWRKAIEDILWQQLYKVKENTLKMYQTKPSKRGKISRTRIKSAGASVFYVSDH